ncbi:MAG TPA: alanine racemase [Planctomycetes bacterium]|nr:alanine racemase [Planctomycetota bacterium]
MAPRHRAWAEINLAAFRTNLREAAAVAKQAKVWPVLKANAYGHGAIAAAKICEAEGINRIGVGDSREALELRESGIRTPLLVLGTVIDSELPDMLTHQIEVGVHSELRARELNNLASKTRKVLGVHLKIDTGMARLGVRPEAALRVAQTIHEAPYLELRGVMTHFSAISGGKTAAGQQALFTSTLHEIQNSGIVIPSVHCASSAALYAKSGVIGNAVRPGISLFGILPREHSKPPNLQAVLSLRAQVVFLKDLPSGTPVGYGGRWVSHRPTRIATLPIGYNDGIPYRLGAEGRGNVLLRGCRCPIVGAISMDYCTVDVGHVPGVALSDVATLIGRDGKESICAEEVAEAAGTIAYEVTCSIGARVRRVFCEENQPHILNPIKKTVT